MKVSNRVSPSPKQLLRCFGAWCVCAFLGVTLASAQGFLGYVTPHSSTSGLYAVCSSYDNLGNEIDWSNCPLTISVTPQPNTNGHMHEGPLNYPTTHPFSTLSSSASNVYRSPDGAQIQGYTDNGTSNRPPALPFAITASLVGQIEILTVSSSSVVFNSAYYYVAGYPNLKYADNQAWMLVGASESNVNTGHGANIDSHWLTQQTYNALVLTTAIWQTRTGNCKICVNDTALHFGGKFDINAIKPFVYSQPSSYSPIPGEGSFRPWVSPHASHDAGSAVDISATTNECPYPVSISKFLPMCVEGGFAAINSIGEGNHAHCNTMNPVNYAH